MVASTILYKYKIYCNTEAEYVYGYNTTPPATCYHNNTHTVNLNSIQEMEKIDPGSVSIKEDKIDIDRTIKIFTICVEDAAFGETTLVTYTFPVIVSMYSFKFITDSSNKGDEFSLHANENTTFGLILDDLEIGATSFHSPPALILYCLIGFHITITDGTNTDELGMVIAIDKNTNIITTENATTHAFSATNTLVQMTIKVLDKLKIGGAGVYDFCGDVIGGTVVPMGTVAKFRYKNNSTSGDPKSLYLYLTTLC